jgi:hypothetical protein
LCDGSRLGRNGLQVVAADPSLRLAHPAPAEEVDDRRDVRRRARLDDRVQRLDAGKQPEEWARRDDIVRSASLSS